VQRALRQAQLYGHFSSLSSTTSSAGGRGSLALGPEHLLAVNLVSAIAFWPSSEISQSMNCWPNSFLTCGCLAGFTSMTRRSPDRIHPALRHDVRSDTSRAQSMAHSSAGRRWWCRRPDREHYQDKRSRDAIESRSCAHAATSQAASGECRAFCGPDGTPRNAKGHPAPVLVPPIATAPSVPHPSHFFPGISKVVISSQTSVSPQVKERVKQRLQMCARQLDAGWCVRRIVSYSSWLSRLRSNLQGTEIFHSTI